MKAGPKARLSQSSLPSRPRSAGSARFSGVLQPKALRRRRHLHHSTRLIHAHAESAFGSEAHGIDLEVCSDRIRPADVDVAVVIERHRAVTDDQRRLRGQRSSRRRGHGATPESALHTVDWNGPTQRTLPTPTHLAPYLHPTPHQAASLDVSGHPTHQPIAFAKPIAFANR